ncbi:MAG: bacillithiol biosynthesis cysteine-adding enzyme BshC [Planctomycetota bacterium]|jgi:bacillithiol biosynthesis cysteine-adding enzyme BshC
MWKREYDHQQTLTGSDFLNRYLRDFDQFDPYFNSDFRDIMDLNIHAHRLNNRTWKPRFDRDLVADLLTDYLEHFPHNRAVNANVKKLRKPKCIAVVTGQQAGLGGGPLFVLYKALTAIHLAQQVEMCSDIPCVPVFWNASDDSDLEEVNRIRSVTADGKLNKFRFKLPAGKTHVRSVEIPAADDPQWQEAAKILPDGPFRDRAEVLLRDSAGRDFGGAFTRLLLELFGSKGLIVVEPWALTAHPAWKRVQLSAIEDHDKHRQILLRATEGLHADGFDPGVAIRNQLNLFRTDAEQRHSIVAEGRRLVVDGVSSPVSKTALCAELRKDPARFTPNVILRPLLQNAIFPTVAYVGGPAEIAYHSLLKGLHRHLKLFFPILFPRLSMTLVDSADTDDFDAMVRFRKKLKWQQSEAEIAYTNANKKLSDSFDTMKSDLNSLPSGGNEATGLQSRIDRSVSDIMQQIRHRPTAVTPEGDEHKLLMDKYFPSDAPQERVVSLVAAYVKYGPRLTDIGWPMDSVHAKSHIALDFDSL